MNYYKDFLKGLVILSVTLMYWLLIMFVGDGIRQNHKDYWDVITIGFIISTIIVNLTLVYIVYTKTQRKGKYSLLLMSIPYLLMLMIVEVYAVNLPRILDIAFLMCGIYLIYKLVSNSHTNMKPVRLLGAYFMVVAVAYPLLYNLFN
ncbi:MAG: hypothetical protein V4506_10595 [Bacteroidota bacterium]